MAQADLFIYTPATTPSARTLHTAIRTTQSSGFGRTTGSFESDVCSLAAPLYDQTGLFAGAVSVACVGTRFTPDLGTLTLGIRASQ